MFNSTSSTEFRSSEVLKSYWNNLKKKTRKFFAEEKMQLYKTGKSFYFILFYVHLLLIDFPILRNYLYFHFSILSFSILFK